MLDFLGRCRSFAMDVHPNSIRQPRHRSKFTSDRSFAPSIVVQLSFNRRLLSHFCAIVALVEAHFGRRHLLTFDFRDFQECEAQNEASPANLCMKRGGAEVGMTAVHHLGGPLGTSCVGVGNGNDCPSVECRESLPRSPHTRELHFATFTSLSLYRLPHFNFAGSSGTRPTSKGRTNQPTNYADLSQDILEGHCPEGRRRSGHRLAHLCRWRLRFHNLRLL